MKLADIFKDGRLVLSAGDDIHIVRHRQDEDTEKANLLLEEHLLSFVLHGHKTLWHPQGKLQIEAGEGFFLARGNYLRAERRVEHLLGYQALVVMLSDGFLASMEGVGLAGLGLVGPGVSEQGVAGAGAGAFHLREDILVKGLVGQLAGYFQAPEEKTRIEPLLPWKIRELLTLLISAGVNEGFGAVIKGLPSRREPSLTALVEAHFRETLTLEQWAFLAGLSLSSFKRKFADTFHMSPGRWIQQRRLEEAYHLLGDRRKNVTEVCFAVGFENLAHFVHVFRERYHITPKQRQMTEPSTV